MLKPIDIKNIQVNSEVVAVSTYMSNLEMGKIYKIKEIVHIEEFNVYQFKLFKMRDTRYLIDRFNSDIKSIRMEKLNKISNYD